MTSETLAEDRYVHISQLPCWTCPHLRKDLAEGFYWCIQNRRIDEMMPANFAEKCARHPRNKGREVCA